MKIRDYSQKANLVMLTTPASTQSLLVPLYRLYNDATDSHHNDGVTAIVDAETGEIEQFGIAYFTPPPTDTSVLINAAQAQSAAQSQLAASGIQDASMRSITTEIVQPNSFWLDGSEHPGTGLGRVAWVYFFVELSNRAGEIWVDAQTGNIIGGSEYGFR